MSSLQSFWINLTAANDISIDGADLVSDNACGHHSFHTASTVASEESEEDDEDLDVTAAGDRFCLDDAQQQPLILPMSLPSPTPVKIRKAAPRLSLPSRQHPRKSRDGDASCSPTQHTIPSPQTTAYNTDTTCFSITTRHCCSSKTTLHNLGCSRWNDCGGWEESGESSSQLPIKSAVSWNRHSLRDLPRFMRIKCRKLKVDL